MIQGKKRCHVIRIRALIITMQNDLSVLTQGLLCYDVTRDCTAVARVKRKSKLRPVNYFIS
jgi:hypothetical protein